MPIKIFGNSFFSQEKGNKNDTSQFVQKPYSGTKSIESNIDEDIDLKNQFRNEKLPRPRENTDAVCKYFVDSGLNHPTIIRNTAHADLNDKNFDNFRFVEVNSIPAVGEH